MFLSTALSDLLMAPKNDLWPFCQCALLLKVHFKAACWPVSLFIPPKRFLYMLGLLIGLQHFSTSCSFKSPPPAPFTLAPSPPSFSLSSSPSLSFSTLLSHAFTVRSWTHQKKSVTNMQSIKQKKHQIHCICMKTDFLHIEDTQTEVFRVLFILKE